jgi:DNA repair protein RadD
MGLQGGKMNDFFTEIVMPILRAYQVEITTTVRKTVGDLIRRGLCVRVILQASTGAGKSVIALYLMLLCAQKGRRCLFVVSGRTLVDQIEKHLKRSGVNYGVIMAGRGRNHDALIQIASKETITSRVKSNRMRPPAADLVIIDEAHESMAKEWVDFLDLYTSATVIGLTATPALGNGKGLGAIWNGLEKAITTKQLVEEKWLVPCRVFAPEKPDLRGIKIVKGDYHNGQLAERMDKPKLTGNVLENWRKYADGKKTVVFGCNIAHALHLQSEFVGAGIKFGHIDQTTEDNEREDIFGAIEAGRMMGFTNVSVARRGLDLPCLEVACVCRPTKSLVLWLQMIGRIRRPWEGKDSCIVIDHAGACDHHCMPDDEIDWRLDAKENVSDRLDRDKETGKLPKSHTCPECHCVFTGKRCPACGYELADRAPAENTIEHADGILVERNGRASASYQEMQRTFSAIIAQTVHKKQKAGAVARRFKEAFDLLPWEVKPKMQYMPPRKKGIWQQPAVELWPEFLRGNHAEPEF